MSSENDEILQKRGREIEEVALRYGFDSVEKLGFETTKLDQCSMGELVSQLSSVFEKVRPSKVYLPFKNDVHSDHRVIFNAAYSCTKVFRFPFIKSVLMMETLSETEFSPGILGEQFCPNVFEDISEYLEKKADILKIYESEIGEHPFPRSVQNVRALAHIRGAMSGVKAAESFVLLREFR